MKKISFYSCTFFLLVLLSCQRSQPDSNIIVPPNTTTLQPIAVKDLSAYLVEPSGIFYNWKNNSLMIVSDERPDIYEMDLNGILIKKISVSGVDMEGITMTKNCDTIIVVEETARLVSTFLYNGTKVSSITVDVATNPSNCLEGITVDNNYHLYIINEKLPMLMLEYFNNSELSRKTLNYTTDISDICYDESLDCFWIISDESKMIFKINRDGSLIKQWLITFDKGEGITFAGDKMYVVCDSDNKMYIYNKPQ